jgi:hypothetical protein
MTNKKFAQAQKLGQKQAIWYLVSETARAWVGEDESQLIRPHMTLIMDVSGDTVRQMEITDSPPDGPELVKIVLDAMLKPGPGAKGKFRPTMIQTEDAAVLAKLQPLTEIGIYCEQKAKPELVQFMLRELEGHMMGGDPLPGLHDVPGVTKEVARDFYAAAAAYFQAVPWEHISDSMPIAISMPPGEEPFYLVVMGNGGETYGLALYEDYEELSLLYSGAPKEAMPDETRWVSITYDGPHFLPFGDLDGIAENNWPIAGPNAYPLFMVFYPVEDEIDRPDPEDIEMATAALRAIPHFVKNYFDPENGPDWEAGEVAYPDDAEEPAFTLAWVDADEMEEIQFENMMAHGQTIIAEFIADWHIDEEDYPEAIRLGSFLYSYAQLMRLQSAQSEDELDEDHLAYIEDLCWEMGVIIMDYAELPFDFALLQGPPLFVKEYKEEWADDKEDVKNYKAMWQHLGEYLDLVNQQAALLEEEWDDEEWDEEDWEEE